MRGVIGCIFLSIPNWLDFGSILAGLRLCLPLSIAYSWLTLTGGTWLVPQQDLDCACCIDCIFLSFPHRWDFIGTTTGLRLYLLLLTAHSWFFLAGGTSLVPQRDLDCACCYWLNIPDFSSLVDFIGTTTGLRLRLLLLAAYSSLFLAGCILFLCWLLTGTFLYPQSSPHHSEDDDDDEDK